MVCKKKNNKNNNNNNNNNNNGLGTRLDSLQMYRLGSDIGQTQHALCNASVQQSATAHEMHILGWLVCPCHDCYNIIPPPSLWPSHDQAELKKATPAGHNIGGILTETQVLQFDYRSYSVSLVPRMSTLLVEIQCQDFSVVSCSSKNININSTLLKCII